MGKPITFGLVGRDGFAVAWSREDAADDCAPGRFSGRQELVDEVKAVLILRAPVVVTQPNVAHYFADEPLLRPVDVAAAMICAMQGSADTSALRRMFPQLAVRSTGSSLH